MEDLYKLKKGDKVLVECTVEAVFVQSGMVMVTTRDCDNGFDAYIGQIKKNKVMSFLLFFLGIMIGAFIVTLILYPILGDTINYIQDLKKELKDMENKENGNN